MKSRPWEGRAGFVGALVLTVGCADPCFDDGLAQGGCPSADAESETATDTATASNTNTDTDSASGSGASDTVMTAGSNSATDTDPTEGTASGGGFECPELNEILLPQVPTIQLVVDQSGSMDQPFGGATRWESIESALVDPDFGVVPPVQSRVRFGLTLYTGDVDTCPILSGLAPQLDAADEIATAIGAVGPLGETPTGESLGPAMQQLIDDPWVGDKIIVLATDGAPDTCAVPNPMTDEEQDAAEDVSLMAVDAAFAEGIRTFVISVGTAVTEEHLQDIANAGVGVMAGEPDAPFYVADDPFELIAAFDTIIAGVRDCGLDLPEPLMEEVADSCTLTVNDTEVPYNDPDGWQLDGENAIELVGAACTSIQEGAVTIQMSCTCEVSS